MEFLGINQNTTTKTIKKDETKTVCNKSYTITNPKMFIVLICLVSGFVLIYEKTFLRKIF